MGSVERWWFRRTFDCRQLACEGFHDLATVLTDADRAFVQDSYPNNHTFLVESNRLIPKPKLAERLFEYQKHYPAEITSFLDLSSSKGFFVFHGAQRTTCTRALGIDIDQQCLEVSRRIASCRDSKSTMQFEEMTIPKLAESIADFGGPFQTALLMNTYQYLFFGSTFGPGVSEDHNVLFELIRSVCNGRLLFNNRISVDRIQRSLYKRVDAERHRNTYTPEAVRRAAEKFFRITVVNRDEQHPFWLLDAK